MANLTAKTRNTLTTKKKVRKQDLDHAIDQEKSKFKDLTSFFYKFPPLLFSYSSESDV